VPITDNIKKGVQRSKKAQKAQAQAYTKKKSEAMWAWIVCDAHTRDHVLQPYDPRQRGSNGYDHIHTCTTGSNQRP
jgi:hypothetical protein